MLHLGFDIGGTHIAAGLITEQGDLIASSVLPFPRGEDADTVAKVVADQAYALSRESGHSLLTIGSVGVAIPGSIDPAGNVVLDAYNLDFHQVPFRSMLQMRFPHLPLRLVNDANAATLAEFICGALKGYKNAVLLTLGTGVGGGLILNGKLFNGGRGSGVELGHMQLRFGANLCTCGQRGCVESDCSATALIRDGRLIFEKSSLLRQMAANRVECLDAKMIVDCAKAEDPACAALFTEYLQHLSSALASLVNLLDPEIIALGGGLSQAGDILYQPLRIQVAEKSFFHSSGEIVPAKLGVNAGLLGAALLHRHLADKI